MSTISSLTNITSTNITSPVSPAGGTYLYVNASSSDASESRALLYSPEVSMLPGEQKCLHFWYFMLGSDSDCCLLRVRVHGSDDVIGGATWSQHGTIRNTWRQAHIDLNVGAPFQVLDLAVP